MLVGLWDSAQSSVLKAARFELIWDVFIIWHIAFKYVAYDKGNLPSPCVCRCASLPPPPSFFLSHGLLCTHPDWCCLLSILCFVGRRWKMSKQIVNRKHRLTKAHIYTPLTVYFRAPLRTPCWWRFNCSSHTHTLKGPWWKESLRSFHSSIYMFVLFERKIV